MKTSKIKNLAIRRRDGTWTDGVRLSVGRKTRSHGTYRAIRKPNSPFVK